MKKLKFLLIGILAVVSSVVFSACNDGYKDLKIECSHESIELVLGASDELAVDVVDFEISGVDSWGEVSITSKPEGLVMTNIKIDGKHCYVQVTAVQPTGEGATLKITHLGSGKSLEVPLNIGMKLQSVQASGNSFIVTIPNNNDIKQFDIPTKDLLIGSPVNFTDNVAWILDSGNLPNGVTLKHYMQDGSTSTNVQSAFTTTETDGSKSKYNGTSDAVKTTIAIASACQNGTSITLNPVTSFKGEAVLHKDIKVEVKFIKSIGAEDLTVTSPTHGNSDGNLQDLVLISNPTKTRKLTGVEEVAEYNCYSTASIDLKVKFGNNYYLLSDSNETYNDVYDVTLSSTIPNLLLEIINIGTYRVTATSTCVGTGDIIVKFTPKNCVGEINEFSINIPCTVGEQATSISATRENYPIEFENGEAIAPLTDDYTSSNGQRFKFNVLSENTLAGLKGYKIKIKKELLYINPNYVESNISQYIKYTDGSSYLLNDISGYQYQICLRKNGREITFYSDGGDFVSEPLTQLDTIYIKYIFDEAKAANPNDFNIQVMNFYNGSYDIKDNGFAATCITYTLNFDRQRKVESVEYQPIKIIQSSDRTDKTSDNDTSDWQFYFTRDMFDSTNVYYGIEITDVKGINNTELNSEEKKKINLDISILYSAGTSDLGVTLYGNAEFEEDYRFNFGNSGDFDGCIIIGKLSGDISLGDYTLDISQNKTQIASRNIKLYKELEEDDITISIPNADYEGDGYLDAGYTELESKPNDWDTNWTNYYEYDGNNFVKLDDASAPTFDTGYYRKDSVYILSTSSQEEIKKYYVSIDVEDAQYVNNFTKMQERSMVDEKGVLISNDYLSGFKYDGVLDEITTGAKGTYNNGQNYVLITYTFTVEKYGYCYKDVSETITKNICLYIYEPLTSASFNKTQLYKYDYDEIQYTEFASDYGKGTLTIQLNSESVFDYLTSIEWKRSGDGYSIESDAFSRSATFKFKTGNRSVSTIVATITQFGVSYPIYCGVVVEKPILTERVVLNNPTHSFKSGGNYLTMKESETITIDASAISSEGEVSLKGFDYVICSTSGYVSNGIVSVDENGKMTAQSAGRVKLIIIAKDRLKASLNNVVNYVTFVSDNTKVGNRAYIMVDILVTDGTSANPFLIADAQDFKNIEQDYNEGVNSYHYALINDINLNGESISFENFNGSITSYQEIENANNRFSIYGVKLNEENPNLFVELGEDANIENIDIYVNIDYTENKVETTQKNIGLIGTNKGTIKNVTISVSGDINLKEFTNTYYIGGLTAHNIGEISITKTTLIGVQGSIIVEGGLNAVVVLGGVAGKNEGSIEGALAEVDNSITADKVQYDVYYGNQGATVDITLQVKSVDVNNYDKSAIGGIVGENYNGTVKNVYATGKVLGHDDKNDLLVNNVGGLIGKNTGDKNIDVTITTGTDNDATVLGTLMFDDTNDFQITNSYSTAQVIGRDNVGGVVGYDYGGSYKKVYYEIYTKNYTAIKGNDNVGGLIGCAEDSNLYYCYINSFAWGYGTSTNVYELVGSNNVGGLIGYAKSSRESNFSDSGAMNIASSLASITISASGETAGLVGRLDGYGALYTTYFYGLINATNYSPIVNMYTGGSDSPNESNTPYKNTYAIINSKIVVNDVFDENDITLKEGVSGFGIDIQYNNGMPYIKYGDTNLVSIVPTSVEINEAFESYKKIYIVNLFGDYVLINGEYVVYNENIHQGRTRYSKMSDIISTGDETSTNSDYRAKAIVLYYYQFSSMAGEYAYDDMQLLNTVDMHAVLNDNGIIVLPNTYKRFTLSSSNSNIVSILDGGKLLLKNEGQATITLTSILNPTATASFVVIVRSKVLEFNLYSSANMLDEYDINGKTLNIVKNSSKLIYADYSSVIQAFFNREYAYNSPTKMKIEFKISVAEGTLEAGKSVIEINGTYRDGKYVVDYGTPITISVNDYFDGKFTITAKPYIVVNYNGSEILVDLSSYFKQEFYVVTRRGASSINTDKTYIEMMPTDETELDVEIKTDIKMENVSVELIAQDSKGNYETADGIDYIDMLDIYYNNTKINLSDGIDISDSPYNNITQLQQFALKAILNSSAYYIDHEFTIQVKLTVGEGENKVSTILHILVKPQEITSIMALNYKLTNDGAGVDNVLDRAELTNIIRPGARNIMIIDIAPHIAVYDYVEIDDLSSSDAIQFIQLNSDLNAMGSMDEISSTGKGIKLKKENLASTLYVSAILPYNAVANTTHTIKISAFDSQGQVLKTTYISLEAILYPTVIATYTYPNGQEVTVDSRKGEDNINSANVDLAVGVEAKIKLETINIDEESLSYTVTVKDGNNTYEEYNDLIIFAYEYDGYMLRFNTSRQANWNNLLGKTIEITFNASKSLNGVTETCSSTIIFNIRKIVIHSVSMQHTDRYGNLYGDYGFEFETQFYFTGTDISYYHNNSYWNSVYTLENTSNAISDDLKAIKNILSVLNNPWNTTNYVKDLNGKFVKVGNNFVVYDENTHKGLDRYTTKVEIVYDSNINDNIEGTSLTGDYSDANLYIKNYNNAFYIKVNDGVDTSNMQLSVRFKTKYENNLPVLENLTANKDEVNADFGFNVTPKSTPLDDYQEIKTVDDFNNMLEGKYYKLVNDDIELENYAPLNVAIGGLDGAGHTITIKSFDNNAMSQMYSNGVAYIGLFGTVQENTIIYNLIVNYDNGKTGAISDKNVTIDLSGEVLSSGETYSEIYFGGIAGQNNGVISNVLITGGINLNAPQISSEKIFMGGITSHNGTSSTTKATITNSTVELSINSLALIGGVANTNYGKIANTIFKGNITCWQTSELASSIFTAGFVIDNRGSISLSAVEENSNKIRSVGTTSGFVSSNVGSITDCYVSRIEISAQGNIGGFVYENSGTIATSYAYAQLVSSRFYEEFIYSAQSSGTLTDCYVISDEETNISGLSKISPTEVTTQEKFKNFIFATSNYGLWSMGGFGPELKNAGYKYDKNILIYYIYDVITFEGFFNTDNAVVIDNEFVMYSNVRIVRDIDLSSLGDNPITHTINFMGTFEGNNMTISGYNIYNDGSAKKIGLFASISQNAMRSVYVRNLVLQPNSVRASGSVMVGGLAGEIDGANIYNVTIDNQDLIVLGRNAVGGLAGIIKGKFEIIGVNSNVSAFAAYTYNVGQQYNLYVGKNVNRYVADNIVDVSYAGAVAGIIDGYDDRNPDMSNRTLGNYYTISKVKISNALTIVGETVGGAFGLVGERTYVNDISYNLNASTKYQGKYYAGGLVGENRGIISNATIVKDQGEQTEASTFRDCFNNMARVNGGIVALNIGGLVYNGYSNIDVYTTSNSATAGGIVGKNIEGWITNCTFGGTTYAYIVAGICASDYDYKTVNSLTNNYGVPTLPTMSVYRNISSTIGVSYIVDGLNNIGKFNDNKLTENFLINFISSQAMYYTFNSQYEYAEDGAEDNENGTGDVVNAYRLYGLFIGLTDSEFNVTVEFDENDKTTLLSTLEEGNGETRADVTIKYNSKEYILKPISTLEVSDFNKYNITTPQNSTKFTLLFLIGCEKATYEYWSSTLNYSNQFIIVTPIGELTQE